MYRDKRYALQGVFTFERSMTYCAITWHSSGVKAEGCNAGDKSDSLARTNAWTDGESVTVGWRVMSCMCDTAFIKDGDE